MSEVVAWCWAGGVGLRPSFYSNSTPCRHTVMAQTKQLHVVEQRVVMHHIR